MAKSKSDRDGSSTDRQKTYAFGGEGQVPNHDPALVSLFSQSLGAVKIEAKPGHSFDNHPTRTRSAAARKSSSGAKTSLKQLPTNLSGIEGCKTPIVNNSVATGFSRNRKRKDAEDDLESIYMNHLAKEEVTEDQRRARTHDSKRPKMATQKVPNAEVGFLDGNGESTSDRATVAYSEKGSAVADLQQHESLFTARVDLDLKNSLRTVFLGNVSTMAIRSKKAKKTLMNHLVSFTSSLPPRDGRHDIESLRFRSTAFAASGMPKKAAFVKKDTMDTTTKSTNAYVVYTTELAAREATVRLNGSIVLDRHLRVDSVAHPAEIDHRRCVFVGNLAFIDDETNVKSTGDEETNKRPHKAKEPADVEEGLWRQFAKAGIVESVRVVRDQTTRVGKGFAYIQFKDANSVEKALLYHEKKFPPMLPRILRVTRAKNAKNTKSASREEGSFLHPESTQHKTEVPPQVQSLTDRAHKLFRRAGEANPKAARGRHWPPSRSGNGDAKSFESIVFEGFRASSSREKKTRRMGRRHKRPSNRSKEFKMRGQKKIQL